MNCVVDAWKKYEAEIRGYIAHQITDARTAEDLLQDTFVKALEEGAGFCTLQNQRAWLFKVVRNKLTDLYRSAHPSTELMDKLTETHEEIPAVETLAACLPRALQALTEKDRDAITKCDLQGMTQTDYAKQAKLSIPGAKSRIQRAREQLKQKLKNNCQVHFDDNGQVCCYVKPTKQ